MRCSRAEYRRGRCSARDLSLGRDEDIGGEDMLPSVPYTFCENPAGRSVRPATAGRVGPELHRVVSAPEASAGLAPTWTSAGPQRTSRAHTLALALVAWPVTDLMYMCRIAPGLATHEVA